MMFSDLFDPSPSDDTRIACDLSALDHPEEHRESFQTLFERREEVRTVPGGVAIRFSGEAANADRITDFIHRERRCCPFLTFGVAYEPEGRGIWLYVGGSDRVESYVRERIVS